MFELFKKKKDIFIGLCKCPTHKKLYGVRIEEEGNKWTATWAFKITEQVAKREKYEANVFPPDIKYHKEYPGCPYCNKHEDLATITKPEEKPIPKKDLKISVTSRGCDDIGSILSSLEIPFRPFTEIKYNCDILFLNCLTRDSVNAKELEKFVSNGGCLYASCYSDSIMKSAFPYIFTTDHSGTPHSEIVSVEDPELKEIIGGSISVKFDTAWAKLYSAKDSKTFLRSTGIKRLPIMVSLRYKKGIIYYTCFHNHVQASDKEKALLQLLVLKQIGSNSNMTIAQVGESMGVDVEAIKKKFKRNF